MALDLHKIGVKFFVEDRSTQTLLEFIPIFHGWIQTYALEDLLIDVADYSHVHAGPGILLIAHEGNYGIDETGDRRGMVYYSKRRLEGSLPERLATVCRKALQACLLLEEEPELEGRIRFRGEEIQIFANDRLSAPNDDETFQAFEPTLTEFLARLYPDDMDCSLTREADPQERLSVTVRASTSVSVGTLLERLEM